MCGFVFPRRRSKKEEKGRGLSERSEFRRPLFFAPEEGNRKTTRHTLLLLTFTSKEK